MLARGFDFAIALVSMAATVSPQFVPLPEGTTGFTPLEGTVTNVQSMRVPLGDAVMGSETRVTFQFVLHGCLDSLMPVMSYSDVQDDQVTLYVTALNVHHEGSQVANCVAMPMAIAEISVPGIFQRDQIEVIFIDETQ